jgi:tripartite-type tricarboxylate transporter receptor subunit TctC
MQPFKTLLATAALALSGLATAQNYPTKPIVFLVNLPGAQPEAIERAIFDKVRENTGATLLYEARPGAGGAVGLHAAKAAAADGYVFSLAYASSINLNPLINKELGIDALRDFVPVTNMMALGVVLATREDFPAKDIRDVVAMAKAKPGTVRVGTLGAGNKSWMAMLEEATGAKFLQAPFKSSAEIVGATLGGHLDIHFDTVATVQAQKGKLKPLSFGGTAPSPQFPHLPLIRDLYKFDMLTWFGVLAPAGAPAHAVNWVSREIARAMKDPKVAQLIESNGFTAVGNTPEEFAKALREEIDLNREIVRKYPDIR